MKSKKGLTLTITLGTLALFLSGCVQTTKAGKPYGFVYEYLAKPGQNVMEWLSQLLLGNHRLDGHCATRFTANDD